MNIDDKIPVGTAEDLTGKQYGQLTVLYRVKNTGNTRGAKWRCQCSCGNITDVLAANLKRNHTLSCGCLQKKKTASARFINEVGNKYGRLTVMKKGLSKKGRITWRCKCECGNIVEVDGTSLRKGLTTSCGCYRKEQVTNRVMNKYIDKTFHYITVLEKTQEKPPNSLESVWKCRCNLCGKEFLIPTSKLKTQVSCGCVKDSYGVMIIKSLLSTNGISFETEKTFSDCVFNDTNKKGRFDFYVNNQYIIEFDGQQHFSFSNNGWNTKEQMLKTQEHDQIKNKWCRNHNIPIVRIPYWAIDNLTIDDLLPNSKFIGDQGEITEDVE